MEGNITIKFEKRLEYLQFVAYQMKKFCYYSVILLTKLSPEEVKNYLYINT
jgi:hypothetical protein